MSKNNLSRIALGITAKQRINSSTFCPLFVQVQLPLLHRNVANWSRDCYKTKLCEKNQNQTGVSKTRCTKGKGLFWTSVLRIVIQIGCHRRKPATDLKRTSRSSLGIVDWHSLIKIKFSLIFNFCPLSTILKWKINFSRRCIKSGKRSNDLRIVVVYFLYHLKAQQRANCFFGLT